MLAQGQETADLLFQPHENPFCQKVVEDLRNSNGTESMMLVTAAWLLQGSQVAVTKECQPALAQ